ncbi:MFS transporter [Streptomyces sp. Go-475]|uniref:MFS transporter n=1 Tax=Streptomyces sp. Go-475 TaxID=2072505 RepID=UPI000DEEC085|nr:MFS transporter [Streptomyces sp. Go-475]AXE88246.1 Inner membrane transport protein YdhP [Streptomyces sp. Go-475]
MPFRLAALILAIFCVGTAELSPSGMLDDLSTDLSVSLASAGLLVTAYALTMVVGGPLVTALTTRVPRKLLLVGLLTAFVLGNVVCALASGFGMLMAGRVLTAVVHGTFMAVCVVTAGDMAGEGKGGAAVAATQLGINLATVLGVPMGSFLAQHYDWRAPFALVAALAAVAIVLILAWVPGTPAPTVTAAHEARVFRRPAVWGTVGATVLCSGGMFTLITYMVPLLTGVGHLPRHWVPAVLLAYGVGSIVGNLLGGRYADRGVDRAVGRISWILVAACLLCWLLAPHAAGGALALVVFSLATFALIPGLQTKVLAEAADAPTLSLTANMSAFGLGAALGSWIGGLLTDSGLGTRGVPLGAAALTASGALLVLALRRAARRAPAVLPANDRPLAVSTAEK